MNALHDYRMERPACDCMPLLFTDPALHADGCASLNPPQMRCARCGKWAREAAPICSGRKDA